MTHSETPITTYDITHHAITPSRPHDLTSVELTTSRSHDLTSVRSPDLTFVAVSGILLVVYAFTLAPTVTLWDAGEFNAAIASLGIPHPPGTPLYIVIGSVWARMLGFLPQAFAVNLLSAVATAIGCGLLAGLVARWTRSTARGIAAGLSSGTMLAVWQNATETEVYALSMLLGVLMVVVGERAGARDDARLRVLLAYLIGLAVPVQISALVAAPAAVLLASLTPGATRPEWRTLFSSGAMILLAAGAGLSSIGPTLAGAVILAVVMRRSGRAFRTEALASVVVLMLALTPTLFMLIRAGHDPLINQGNPATFADLADVVSRAQYQAPGLWPRSAPAWVQLLNLVQYADWQVASGLDASVAASWRRTPFSIAAMLLAIVGWRYLRSVDRRGAWGVAVLLLMSSLGVVAVLNLRAGPSILDSILPAGATHEPRERDYFFALAFATTGLLAGIGAVRLASRWMPRLPNIAATIAVGVAFLPVILNWSAANRRPEGYIADALGESLLASVPPNAVLLLAGDNDSYTTWYRQAALDDRRDVVPVTISLLPAGWYREELARRHQLLAPDEVAEWRGTSQVLLDLAAGARRTGRPLAAAVSVNANIREPLAPAWTLGGMAYVADVAMEPRTDAIDVMAAERIAQLVTPKLPAGEYDGRDPAVLYVVRLLNCPIQALRMARAASGTNDGPSLDPRCNFK